ncbi:hypothetical protein PORUE0001_1003 [Porphyromonas uenonis 60-3]|uniref:LysM domain protein n=1 Tax=Porphyromonas uenonis 60-3 TaxID=596327 RepID=C2MAZ1_9PORP|nr:hypothetical protein [Porphyromonas uenonis]EEK17088.1 hypothetical protein PORUE0001_1003 [Porphyromonas uenonis 60-3]
MITTEQWLLEVAEQSQLAQTTCQQLWSDLTSLLIGRLTQGSSSYMRSVGLWSAESHSARIALLPSGERYLMPPSVMPRITNQEQPLSAEEIGELLAKGAIQIPQTLQSFYDSVTKLFEMHERLGHTLEWTPLGTFAPQSITGEDESSETSYAFTPSDELLRQVNKPFEMFAPTLLKEGVQWPDVEEQPAESLEQACPSIISSRIAESTATPQPASTPPAWTPQSQAVTPATPTPPPFSASESSLPTAKATTPPPPPASESNEPEAVIATPPPYRREEPQERKPRKLWLWIVIPLVAVLVMALLLWFFAFGKQEMPSSRTTPPPSTMIPVEATPTIDTVAPIDSVAPVADTTAQQEILTTVILGNGDYLARYAHRYLGRSEYWIYIYLANKEQIKDPDNIPLGTEIKIPSPQSVGITGNQEADLATAKRLIHDYYSTTAKS